MQALAVCVAFSLATVGASEVVTSCDADDHSCISGPETGSMLIQVDRSQVKEAFKTASSTSSSSSLDTSIGFSTLAHRVAPSGFCKDHPCRASMLANQVSPTEQASLGKSATLSQMGYAKVAALKDDTQMMEFMLRVIDKYDCKVEMEAGLKGAVPWFSGTTMVQDFAKLEDTLLYAVLSNARSKSWLSFKNSEHITGDTANLDFVGYVQIAAMKNDGEMQKFAKRVCSDMGVNVLDQGGFEGMIKFYSGVDNFQSYERLQSEIKSAANAPHTWAAWAEKPTNGFSQLAHRAEAKGGFSLLAVKTESGFCKGYPCSALLQSPETRSSQGMGKYAQMTQAGYASVAALKSDAEMKDYILRMVDRYDCKVEHMGGLNGIVPWFSGTTSTQDIQNLESTLLYAVLSSTKNPWISYKNTDRLNGDTVKLSFIGYVQIAAMRNDAEMKKFVRRVCKDMGVEVQEEGGLEGMVKFYSGTDNFQSYERLQTEIKSAANAPHSWARWATK